MTTITPSVAIQTNATCSELRDLRGKLSDIGVTVSWNEDTEFDDCELVIHSAGPDISLMSYYNPRPEQADRRDEL